MNDDETQRLCTETIDLFAELPADLRGDLCRSLETVRVSRGDVLVREGGEANAMYVVVSGRFEVRTEGREGPLAEIGAGQLIGEVAFLAGGGRTATAVALRESVVLCLTRTAFDALADHSPLIWKTLTITLARRLADRNRLGAAPPDPRPSTIAIIPSGRPSIPTPFRERFQRQLAALANVHVVTVDDCRRLSVAADRAHREVTGTLNALEADYDYVVYVADDTLTEWSMTAVRQADLVLSVAMFDGDRSAPVELNDIERFSHTLHGPAAQRLVLLHDNKGPVHGTRWWLRGRSVHMHHHICLDDDRDYARLVRFIHGTATGLVACGGGALCAAHVGLFQALTEAGVTFDMMGGTSGGAAMTAAFAMGETPEQIEQQTQDMFVTGGAMRRYTLPVYSLLDQTHFDTHLRNAYGDYRIEDLWLPYFAVSTNLSSGGLHCQREGELWEAVRASGSVPALLPPFFTDDGEMLVDGGLVDNVPIRVMRDLKSGPNIVVAFHVPAHQPFPVNYGQLPSRGQLLRRLATAKDRKQLGDVPMIGAVLSRALMAGSEKFDPHLGPDDLLMVPPLPPEIGLLDWHRHGELKAGAYEWTKAEVARLRARRDHALAQMISLEG
ncbi:MAG: patatin-like phospholipase family protein [Hyphomicrobiaceae bacterium]